MKFSLKKSILKLLPQKYGHKQEGFIKISKKQLCPAINSKMTTNFLPFSKAAEWLLRFWQSQWATIYDLKQYYNYSMSDSNSQSDSDSDSDSSSASMDLAIFVFFILYLNSSKKTCA